MAQKLVAALGVAVSTLALVSGHGAMVHPRSRNSVDFQVNVNTQRCSNLTGDKCNNGRRFIDTPQPLASATHSRLQRHVRAVAPDLSRSLTIVPEPKDILARL